jgi:catechol 2,3-dioxygenase-like lactoylglutathione lyase family enzyme
MKISQCLHAAILVTDLARAEEFYGSLLGLEKIDRALKYPGAWYRVGAFQIHLMADSRSAAPPANPERWGRNPHIALEVEDLNAAIAQLQSHGIPVQMSASGRSACFTRDPDGNAIELQQVSAPPH